jgi:IS5 family transposase
MFIEQDSYRQVVVRVEDNEFFRSFIKLGHRPMMDYTFLCRAYCALSDETLQKMNDVLSSYAKKEGKISAEKMRLDSTAYETNIHYPTDSSLLWDSYRVLSRLMRRLKDPMRRQGMHHRFHPKKVKKLSTYISRNASKKSKRTQRKIRSTYRTLIERVRRMEEIALYVTGNLKPMTCEDIALCEQLRLYLPAVNKIIDQAERRVFKGETVPSAEKVYSLFETHTELLKRGKARAPIEFGHKVLLAQTGEKFIHHYQTFHRQEADKDLLQGSLKSHKKLFGSFPETLAADKGFYESRDQIKKLSKKIATVSMPKKGRRTASEERRESTDEFRDGQRFRAGSEGTISVLKRALKMNRCLFKGFKNYAASVGCIVFCHNLLLLSRL